MKNQNTFLLIGLIVLIAVLIIVQLNFRLKTATPANTSISPITQTVSTTTPTTKTYSDALLSFQYSPILSVQQNGQTVEVTHSITYKHPDPCDFKDGTHELDTISDFKTSFTIINKNLKEYVQSSQYPGWEYVSKNPYISDFWGGYKVTEGVEGCGKDTYYLIISQNKTLVVERPLVAEFSPINADSNKYLNLPGIVLPDQADKFFSDILSTLRIK